jgi:hypothetical protein
LPVVVVFPPDRNNAGAVIEATPQKDRLRINPTAIVDQAIVSITTTTTTIVVVVVIAVVLLLVLLSVDTIAVIIIIITIIITTATAVSPLACSNSPKSAS